MQRKTQSRSVKAHRSLSDFHFVQICNEQVRTPPPTEPGHVVHTRTLRPLCCSPTVCVRCAALGRRPWRRHSDAAVRSVAASHGHAHDAALIGGAIVGPVDGCGSPLREALDWLRLSLYLVAGLFGLGHPVWWPGGRGVPVDRAIGRAPHLRPPLPSDRLF